MGWSGGVYTKGNSATGGWTGDAASGIGIEAGRHDTQDNDFATGINTCLTKDGQNTPTANLPMGGFKHTGIANASARTDYAAFGQVQDSTSVWGGTSAGTSTAYTLTLTPGISTYVAGQRFSFKAHVANGVTATIAISGLAAKTIKRQGTALVGNEFIANDIIDIEYDGTDFQLLNVVAAPLFLDRTNSNVGIGTTSPTERLSIVSAAGINSYASIRGNNNAATDELLFGQSSTGTALLAQKANTIFDIVTGAGVYNSNGAAIRLQSSGVGRDGTILFSTNLSGTGSAERMRIENNGRVGIGTNAPSYLFQLSTDSAAKPTTNTWTIASDARIKTNVKPYEKGLEAICQVNPITYDYNGKAGMPIGSGGVSIIAQDLEPIFPECIGRFTAKLNEGDQEETELLNYNGHAMTFALINAVKQLNAKMESLEARIAELEE
jgi:hypothetical protein